MREQGYYWVAYQGAKMIMLWMPEFECWFSMGVVHSYSDSELREIHDSEGPLKFEER